MRIDPFRLERYFERHEPRARYVLGASDAEPLALAELLALAGDDGRERWERLMLGYGPVRGSATLREAIAGTYERVEPDDVVVFNGAEEAILATIWTAVEPGDHVVCVTPTYQSHYSLPRALGAEVTCVRLDEGAGWALDADAVAAALRPRTRMLVLCVPNNPTGSVPARDAFLATVAHAEDAGALVLCDEAYRSSEHDPAVRVPAAADCTKTGISVGVMSKAYGLGGLRIGWIACRDAARRDAIVGFKHYQSICPATPSEALAAIALGAAKPIRARMRAIVEDGLPRVQALVDRHADRLSWTPPVAANVGYVRLAGRRRSDRLAAEALDDHGVFVVPSTTFDDGAHHLRLGYARRGLAPAVAAFDRFLTAAA